MAFHEAIVELADSERLNTLFSQLLAELQAGLRPAQRGGIPACALVSTATS